MARFILDYDLSDKDLKISLSLIQLKKPNPIQKIGV